MKNRNIIKQSYELVNARYKLSTNELKMIMLVIAQINLDDDDFQTYMLKVSDIDTKLSSGVGYTRLKKLTKDIMSKPLTVDTDFGFKTFNWFSSINYYEKTGTFELRISSDLRPYLLDLKKRFVKYNLKYILSLTSSYSIRIYQLLKEYEKLQKRTFTVSELQDILQVPKSLKIYNRFKEKVLKVAEKELIEHCDIFFEYEEIKEGRRVNEILFRIKNNHWLQDQEQIIPGTEIDQDLKKYIGKQIYLNGYDWKIVSISKNNNLYSIFCHDLDDKNYIKTFEVSKVQLQASK